MYQTPLKAGEFQVMTQAARRIVRTSVLVLSLVSLVGCGHLPTLSTLVRWPFSKQPEAPSGQADELVITYGDSPNVTTFPQFWQRYTLVLDLREVSGSGSVVIQPRLGTTWPMRMALLVRPGEVGSVEVNAAQRVVFPVTNEGMRAVSLELSPGVYTPQTQQMIVKWSKDPTRIVAPTG